MTLRMKNLNRNYNNVNCDFLQKKVLDLEEYIFSSQVLIF